jgi:hypothetical protein
MRYMLLLYANHAEWGKLSAAEMEAVMRDHTNVVADLEKTRRYKTCDALEPVTAATTVRVRSGKTLVSDGPFAETKEQLGGYYVIEASNLDEAIAIAARIPDARYGCVEIRPIHEFSS